MLGTLGVSAALLRAAERRGIIDKVIVFGGLALCLVVAVALIAWVRR